MPVIFGFSHSSAKVHSTTPWQTVFNLPKLRLDSKASPKNNDGIQEMDLSFTAFGGDTGKAGHSNRLFLVDHTDTVSKF